MEKPLLLTLVVRAGRNAGLKAPLDIGRILERTGEVENAIFYTERGNDYPVYLDIMDMLRKSVCKERMIILQYPLQPAEYHAKQKEFIGLLKDMRPDKTIILIHDINHIRYPDVRIYQQEMEWLARFRYFIVHNTQMERYLKRFVPNCVCIKLELFDYLCSEIHQTSNSTNQEKVGPQIVFAGSLSREKAPFIYLLEKEKMNFEMNLYGRWSGRADNSKIWYWGSVDAEILPECFIGDLGLVWDGQIDAPSDQSPQRQYNKFNMPHKFSCYMAAGLPVVAWRNSAIAEVIDRYQVGYLIENIYEINDLDMSRYEYYKDNVQELSEKVRTGYFTLRMWEEVKRLQLLK